MPRESRQKLLIDEMRRNGVKNISVKFSGRRGFHLGVAGGGFPKEVNMNPISKMFPELPQKIAFYLSEKIRPELAKKLIALDPLLEEKMKEENGALNPYNVLDVEQNWSVRHLSGCLMRSTTRLGMPACRLTRRI